MIATHRTSPYLAEALASLRGQTYPTWRLILVDDGSGAPDEIDELARAIPGSTVIHQANAGVAAARNRAIRSGEGEVVAFLDDDDRWPSDRLEQLIRALDRRPGALGAFGNGVYIDQDGRPFGSWHTEGATSEAFLRGDTPIPRITAMVVVRDALERIRGSSMSDSRSPRTTSSSSACSGRGPWPRQEWPWSSTADTIGT